MGRVLLNEPLPPFPEANPIRTFAPPRPRHLLFPDESGRNLFVGTVPGGPVSRVIGPTAAPLAALLDTMPGAMAGFVPDVMALHSFGDVLRDLLDPRFRIRRGQA